MIFDAGISTILLHFQSILLHLDRVTFMNYGKESLPSNQVTEAKSIHNTLYICVNFEDAYQSYLLLLPSFGRKKTDNSNELYI